MDWLIGQFCFLSWDGIDLTGSHTQGVPKKNLSTLILSYLKSNNQIIEILAPATYDRDKNFSFPAYKR